MAIENMSRDQLISFVERNREKANKLATNALRVGEFTLGAMGTTFVRAYAKNGMPQLFGRDASLVLGAAGVAYGLLMGEKAYATDAMFVGAGMLAETALDWGRQLGENMRKGGQKTAGITAGAYALPAHSHVHSYLDPHHHAYSGAIVGADTGPSADLGFMVIEQARRATGAIP